MVRTPDHGPSGELRAQRDAELIAAEARRRRALQAAALYNPGFRLEMGPNRPGFSDGQSSSDGTAFAILTGKPRVYIVGIAAITLILGGNFKPSTLDTEPIANHDVEGYDLMYRGLGSATDVTLPSEERSVQIFPTPEIPEPAQDDPSS